MACEYTILGFRHVNIQNPLGGFTGAQEVTWTTKGAPLQRTTIPDSEFSDATVRAEIEKRCTEISSLLGPNG